MKKFKTVFLAFFTLVFSGVVLVFSGEISQNIFIGINLCLKIIIPSLFCFMVISDFAVKTGVLNKCFSSVWILKFIADKIFKLPVCLLPVVFLSLLGGYPVGAKMVCDLASQNVISKKTAARMMCFCVHSGPAFLVSSVALPMFGSFKLGIIYIASNIISCIVTAFLFSFLSSVPKVNYKASLQKPGLSALISSVNNAGAALLNICGLIIFFSGVFAILEACGIIEVIINFLPVKNSKMLVYSLIDVTALVRFIGIVKGSGGAVVACIATAFGGLCVMAQIMAVNSRAKIPLKKFFLSRIIYTAINVSSFTLLVKLLGVELAVFSKYTSPSAEIFTSSPIGSLLLILVVLMLLATKPREENKT